MLTARTVVALGLVLQRDPRIWNFTCHDSRAGVRNAKTYVQRKLVAICMHTRFNSSHPKNSLIWIIHVIVKQAEISYIPVQYNAKFRLSIRPQRPLPVLHVVQDNLSRLVRRVLPPQGLDKVALGIH